MPNVRRTLKRKRSAGRSFVKRVRRGSRFRPRPRSIIPQRTSVNTGLGFPRMIKMAHRYSQTVRLTSTSGVPTFQRFRANGMFDPDYSGGGHQPLFFDQMTPLYNHFTVIAAKAKITFVHSGTGVPMHIGVLTDDNTTTTTNITALMEQTQNKSKTISYGNSPPKTLMHNFSAKKTFGGSILANNSLQGTSGADPTEQSYFTVYAASVDGVSTSIIDAIVTIDYIAVWTEMVEVTGS
nr:MAG: putative capsid protein [Arizlama virus]